MTDRPFGPEMRRLRIAVGLSLKDLSVRVHYSKGYLSRIENGVKNPHPDLARLVDHALGADGALITLVPNPNRTSAAATRRVEPPPPIDLGGLHEDPRSVDSYADIFVALRRVGRGIPAGQLIGQLELCASTLIHAARGTRGEHQARLLALAARYAEYLGWMYQEFGQDETALAWTDRAVHLADHAGDDEMSNHALVRRSLFSLYEGEAAETIRLAELAVSAPEISPNLRRLALQRQAQGYALAGDLRRTMRALEETAAVPLAGPDQPTLGPKPSAEILAMTKAWCLVELGQAREAAELFAENLPLLPPDSRRSRARFGIRQTLAHVLDGELDQACAVAETILPDYQAVNSATVRVDAARLWHLLIKHQGYGPARDLAASIRTP